MEKRGYFLRPPRRQSSRHTRVLDLLEPQVQGGAHGTEGPARVTKTGVGGPPPKAGVSARPLGPWSCGWLLPTRSFAAESDSPAPYRAQPAPTSARAARAVSVPRRSSAAGPGAADARDAGGGGFGLGLKPRRSRQVAATATVSRAVQLPRRGTDPPGLVQALPWGTQRSKAKGDLLPASGTLGQGTSPPRRP